MKKILQRLMVIQFIVASSYLTGISQEIQPKYSAEINDFYQTFTYNLEECGCNVKSDRTSAITKRLIPSDFKGYKLIAYKISFVEANGVAALAKVMEQDFGVIKAGFADEENDNKQDYLYLLVSDKFDNISFEKAGEDIFDTFDIANAANVLQMVDLKLHSEYLKTSGK